MCRDFAWVWVSVCVCVCCPRVYLCTKSMWYVFLNFCTRMEAKSEVNRGQPGSLFTSKWCNNWSWISLVFFLKLWSSTCECRLSFDTVVCHLGHKWCEFLCCLACWCDCGLKYWPLTLDRIRADQLTTGWPTCCSVIGLFWVGFCLYAMYTGIHRWRNAVGHFWLIYTGFVDQGNRLDSIYLPAFLSWLFKEWSLRFKVGFWLCWGREF